MMKFFMMALVSVFLFSSSVYAQSNCMPKEEVRKNLAKDFKEKLNFAGITELNIQEGLKASTVLEIYTNKKTRTFTIVVHRTSKLSCISVTGTQFFETKDLLD